MQRRIIIIIITIIIIHTFLYCHKMVTLEMVAEQVMLVSVHHCKPVEINEF